MSYKNRNSLNNILQNKDKVELLNKAQIEILSDDWDQKKNIGQTK